MPPARSWWGNQPTPPTTASSSVPPESRPRRSPSSSRRTLRPPIAGSDYMRRHRTTVPGAQHGILGLAALGEVHLLLPTSGNFVGSVSPPPGQTSVPENRLRAVDF